MKRYTFLSLCFMLVFPLIASITSVFAEETIVHAVIFYSPSCSHCHKVIQEDLPPLIEKYGDQLIIIGINTQSIEGQEMYQAMTAYFQLPPERMGVPALVVGETVLVGSLEIPQQFPEIIEKGLAEGGIAWPTIPGLVEAFTASIVQATSLAESATHPSETVPMLTPTKERTTTLQVVLNTPEVTITVNQTPTFLPTTSLTAVVNRGELPPAEPFLLDESLGKQGITKIFMRDPIGNSTSVIVLVGMLASVVIVGTNFKKPKFPSQPWPHWVIPILVGVGFIVAGYLSYVEVTQTDAVCGPVGDCNTVQQSSYARIFGLIPVGILGIVGYVAIIFAWGIQNYGPSNWRKCTGWSIWSMALLGTLFSIYLTFLEPFIIGATCAWCLTSAMIMTLLLWATSSRLKIYDDDTNYNYQLVHRE